MSDFFGALLRSAGALPVGAQARPGSVMPDGDPFEHAFEHAAEPAAAQSGTDADAGAAALARPDASPARAADADAAASSQYAPRKAAPERSNAGLLSGLAHDAALHPAVQAALRWVAAGAALDSGARDTADGGAWPAAADPMPASRSAAGGQPGSPPHSQSPPPSGDRTNAAASTAAQPTLHGAATPRQAGPDATAALAWHDAARNGPASRATVRAAQAARDDRVEVTIGSIHLSVDAAPAPRAVLQSAPVPPRPVPAPSTPRSDFARNRLPRG